MNKRTPADSLPTSQIHLAYNAASSDSINARGATTVAVVGAGQMGSGIGQVFASAGFRVKMYDLSDHIFESSSNRISDSLKKLESKNLLDKPAKQIQELISYHTNMDELVSSDIFIESAFEDFSIKTSIFQKLSKILTATSYVASNTSSYSITALSQMVPWPEKFIGFHFMNPPPIISMIEIIRGLYTSDATNSFFWKLAHDLKKIPIASKNSPGFVLNRILIPMINEAIYVFYEGISTVEEIDEALKLGANHPIGPLALADLIGLDTVHAIMKTLRKEMGDEKYQPCPLLENYVSRGRLGKKTKKGFYDY
ncbi:putative 3-hydroxybutyryl-CoA dehydrogenase [Alphaproteobacteria bacterium]|nr:putative 3-hydroxybutyryl-CoA dehydrogenase [Alphaproteobacteria bacterium]